VNYRHAYHAGNGADVLKHVALVALLDHLGKKSSPFCYLDTHSGRGMYPLGAPETQRAGEFRDGIAKLIAGDAAVPQAVGRYLDVVRNLGTVDGALVRYPGSPAIALSLLRATDRAVLVEMQHGEANALKALAKMDSRAQIHERDGHEALLALIPPKEKRGVVLMDPPYEDPSEFARLEQTIQAAHHRWATGVFAIWYPIKQGDAAQRFVTRMAATGIRRQLVIELTHEQDDLPGGLNGSGILVVNPPYQFDVAMKDCLPWLHSRLSRDGRGRHRVVWSVPE
jgi:23S rRNA (adenine2030-N6)-methyltransferase